MNKFYLKANNQIVDLQLQNHTLFEEKVQLEERISKMKKDLSKVKQMFETQLQKEIEEKNHILTEQISKIDSLEKY